MLIRRMQRTLRKWWDRLLDALPNFASLAMSHQEAEMRSPSPVLVVSRRSSIVQTFPIEIGGDESARQQVLVSYAGDSQFSLGTCLQPFERRDHQFVSYQ